MFNITIIKPRKLNINLTLWFDNQTIIKKDYEKRTAVILGYIFRIFL